MNQFQLYLGKKVFEAGSGRGNLTGHLIDRESLVVADIDDRHVREIEKRFGHPENLRAVQGDLEDPGLYEALPSDFDSVLSGTSSSILTTPRSRCGVLQGNPVRGNLLVLVPGHEWLFSEADAALGDRQRFTEEL